MGLSAGRVIVGAVVAIVAISVLLWIPVLWDRFTDFLSRNGPKIAPPTILGGGSLIGLGAWTGVRALELAGGCAIGLLVLAYAYEQY